MMATTIRSSTSVNARRPDERGRLRGYLSDFSCAGSLFTACSPFRRRRYEHRAAAGSSVMRRRPLAPGRYSGCVGGTAVDRAVDLLAAPSRLADGACQWHRAAFVPTYRCGTAPDSHRIPSSRDGVLAHHDQKHASYARPAAPRSSANLDNATRPSNSGDDCPVPLHDRPREQQCARVAPMRPNPWPRQPRP